MLHNSLIALVSLQQSIGERGVGGEWEGSGRGSYLEFLKKLGCPLIANGGCTVSDLVPSKAVRISC
jgi:hypothetical protein